MPCAPRRGTLRRTPSGVTRGALAPRPAEVANTSLSKDRNINAPLYAASGFREYWLMNVPEQAVEVFRALAPNGYAQCARYAASETIALEAFPDVRIQVTRLF